MQLMNIRLMPHIKNYLILRKVKLSVQGNGKLHDSQIAPQMSAVLTDLFYQEFPDLACKPGKFAF